MLLLSELRKLFVGLGLAAGLGPLRPGPAQTQSLAMRAYTAANGLPTDTIGALGPGLRGRQWAATVK